MNRLFAYGLIVFGIFYIIKGGTGILNDFRGENAASVLRGITQSELNQKIIDHYRTTVLDVGELYADAIKTTVADLNEDGKDDIIAVVESGTTCGANGCIASIFMENESGELVAIPFSYAVKDIEVLESSTGNMHDLQINGNTSHRLIWNGTTYAPEQM